jgi:MFS family permease
VAASTISNVPQFASRGRGLRCGYLHAKRGSRLADGIPPCRAYVCGPHPDCIRPAVLSPGVAGGGHRLLLLILTFALSAGDAFETPTWRAVLPELVPKEDLPAASALNGIEFNFARAVGPALAGFVIAFAGIGAAFLLNTLSFFGVILVVARWKRPAVKRATPPETVTGATVAAIRYVRYSPAVRIVLLRAGTAMFFASGLLALLPSIAHRSNDSPVGYGILLGGFGLGAVFGALVMQRARSRWPADVIVSAGIVIFGLTAIAAGTLRELAPLAAVMLIGGAAWISFISLFNVQVLNRTGYGPVCSRFRCWCFKEQLPPEAPRGARWRRGQGWARRFCGPAPEQSCQAFWDSFCDCLTRALI